MISIAKALGMIFVVLGHMPGGFAPYPFLPYTFHIPLFFFLSGLVLNSVYLGQPRIFVARRFYSLLVPYFGYNFAFALITLGFTNWLGLSFSSNRWNDPWMLLVEPFISGHQYMLFAPGWFLCSLFLVGVVYLFLARILERLLVPESLKFMLFLTLAVSGMLYGKLEPTSDYFNRTLNMVVAKNLSCLFFFYFGTLSRKTAIITWMQDLRAVLVVCFIQAYCVKHFDANFYVAMNTYPDIPSSLLTSLCGITTVIFLASLLAWSDRSGATWLDAIGNSSLHILACHLTIFHLLNIVLLEWHGNSLEVLSRQFYYVYDAQHFWPVFLAFGLGIPTIVATRVSLLQHAKMVGKS